jgi:outer membrane protein TolC
VQPNPNVNDSSKSGFIEMTPTDVRMPHRRFVLMLAISLSLAACTTQPAYQQPTLQTATAWTNAAPAANVSETADPVASETWWVELHDPAIDTLTAAALADSPTLAQAAARVDEARATLTVSKAQRLPQLTANAGVARAKSQDAASITGPSTVRTDSGSIGPNLNWELDLWGRAKASSEAARNRLDARNADAHGARLSLAAQVAEGVLSLRACNYSLAVRDDDIASRETELRLMHQRLAAGNVAPVDEANASSNLASARTNRFSQQEQCARDVDALVALSGSDAATIRELMARPLTASAPAAAGDSASASPRIAEASATSVMPTAPPLLPAMPATVLLTHPSVVSAEREAAASWSEIGVARANRLPQIDLAAVLTGQWLRAFGSTVHFETWSVGPNLFVPLFDGGSGAANVRGAEARYREAVATLHSTLRSAVQNVEDALAAQVSAEQRVTTSQQAVDAARVALRANEARWRAGSISLFELEDTRRQFNSTQESAIAAARDRAQAWVDLVRASGNADSPRTTDKAAGDDTRNPIADNGSNEHARLSSR